MFWEAATYLNYMIGGSVFVLVLSIWTGLLLLWWRHRAAIQENVGERLGYSANPENARVLRLWHDGREATTRVTGTSTWTLIVRHADAWAQAMGWNISGIALVFDAIVGGAIIALVTFVFTQQLLLTIAVPAMVGLLVNMYAQHCWQQHMELFEEQFLNALQVATTSLRAGHPLSGAFRFVAVEIDPPVGELFAEVTQEQELGVSLEEALREVANTSYSSDMKLFATSVLIQIKSGGNLAEMMQRLGDVIRDRLRRRRRLRVLTAETQLSKRVLLAMPIVAFVGLNFLRPEYMRFLYDTSSGRTAVGVALALLLVGWWIMNRLAALES